jgi:hypothetical protein
VKDQRGDAAMTTLQQKRLAEVRMHWLLASAEFDTTFWESTFFLQLIDEQNRTIQAMKEKIQRKGDFNE